MVNLLEARNQKWPYLQWVARGILILAVIWPLFFFKVFYDLAALQFSPNEWWHIIETILLIVPLGIVILAWLKPIPGGILSTIIAPASFLWALSLVIAKGFDNSYIWPAGIQSILLITGGIAAIVAEQQKRRDDRISQGNLRKTTYRWLAWLSLIFLVLAAIILILILIWNFGDLGGSIFIGLCLAAIVIAWIWPLPGGIILTLGTPPGVYSIIYISVMNSDPRFAPPLWWQVVFFNPLSLAGMVLFTGGILSLIWGWQRSRNK